MTHIPLITPLCRNRIVAGLLAGLSLFGLANKGEAATAVGDWGHFLRYAPKVYLYNPDGRDFSITIHQHRFPNPSWVRGQMAVQLTAPDGQVLLEGDYDFETPSRTFDINQAEAGVYLLEVNLPAKHVFRGPDFWVESTLDRAVAFTGDPYAKEIQGNALAGRWLVTQCSVPRRWWFWVPPGTKSFTVRTQWIDAYQSQRENWGITLISPRGQRVGTLWGDLDRDRGRPFKTPESRTASLVVNVEPGASGRFWAAEIRLGDSHHYSKISFSLEGVPPYVSRSPEDWFNPEDPSPLPTVPLYDEDGFMQFAMDEATREAWPWLQHFSPCPSLGDPDGSEIRGDATFHLWNPENRSLALRVGTYIPRPGKDGRPPQAQVTVRDARGKVIQDREEPMIHLHGKSGEPENIPPTGAGVAQVDVQGTERWMAFTYPATPIVLEGLPEESGWSRFAIEVGTARNWYFYVPPGTERFGVRFGVEHPTDRLHLEINTPDRTAMLLYGEKGETWVDVPPGMDGRIWHLRVDIGSGTRMITDGGPDSRFLGIYSTIELNGVPALLAPTWEQWFDPSNPRTPWERRLP